MGKKIKLYKINHSQSVDIDLGSADEATAVVEKSISESRESDFDVAFDRTQEMAKNLPDMEEFRLPRQRFIDDNGDIRKHFRIQYKQFIDRIISEMKDRFHSSTESSDIGKFRELCNIIKTGEVTDIIRQYPELDYTLFKIQLRLFKEATGASSLFAAKTAYREMGGVQRGLFPEVFKFLRILLVCPVSSSSCERSFSALRRLKTWLRVSLTQSRLNYNAVCSIHSEILDELDLGKILNEFTSRTENRKRLFGIGKFEVK